jgi:2-iminobutanoate/2-iminopropanoate deaminase
MTRSIVRSADAPQAIGPYSQAVVVPMGDQKMVFCSGQIALSPATGTVIDGDVAAQTRQVMANIAAVLTAAGANFSNVVKTTVFLADMGDFSTVNAIYGESFPNDPPARSTVAVAGLPRNVRVEIEVLAVISAKP